MFYETDYDNRVVCSDGNDSGGTVTGVQQLPEAFMT